MNGANAHVLYLADRKPVAFRDGFIEHAVDELWGYSAVLAVEATERERFAERLLACDDGSRTRTARAWITLALDTLLVPDGPACLAFSGCRESSIAGDQTLARPAHLESLLVRALGPVRAGGGRAVHENCDCFGHAPWTALTVPLERVEYAANDPDSVLIRLVDLLLAAAENALHWQYRDPDRETLALDMLPAVERAMADAAAGEPGAIRPFFFPRGLVDAAQLAGPELPEAQCFPYHDPAIRSMQEPTLFGW